MPGCLTLCLVQGIYFSLTVGLSRINAIVVSRPVNGCCSSHQQFLKGRKRTRFKTKLHRFSAGFLNEGEELVCIAALAFFDLGLIFLEENSWLLYERKTWGLRRRQLFNIVSFQQFQDFIFVCLSQLGFFQEACITALKPRCSFLYWDSQGCPKYLNDW